MRSKMKISVALSAVLNCTLTTSVFAQSALNNKNLLCKSTHQSVFGSEIEKLDEPSYPLGNSSIYSFVEMEGGYSILQQRVYIERKKDDDFGYSYNVVKGINESISEMSYYDFPNNIVLTDMEKRSSIKMLNPYTLELAYRWDPLVIKSSSQTLQSLLDRLELERNAAKMLSQEYMVRGDAIFINRESLSLSEILSILPVITIKSCEILDESKVTDVLTDMEVQARNYYEEELKELKLKHTTGDNKL